MSSSKAYVCYAISRRFQSSAETKSAPKPEPKENADQAKAVAFNWLSVNQVSQRAITAIAVSTAISAMNQPKGYLPDWVNPSAPAPFLHIAEPIHKHSMNYSREVGRHLH